MKKTAILIMAFLMIIVTGCKDSKENDAIKFKEEYESLNGVETSTASQKYRTITISEENPFKYVELDEINRKIENKETFIVYFGANWSPWCRSVLPTFIEESKENKIDTIYYVNVRPENDIEKDIRDIYSLDESDKPYISHKGTSAYHKFLTYASDVLSDYSSNGVKVEGVKRVGAPNFIIVNNGKVVEKINGISSKQDNAYAELNDEIIKDMQETFMIFFEKLEK